MNNIISRAYRSILIVMVLLLTGADIGSQALAAELSFDIVINGGTFSPPAAALSAARANPAAQILLVEPTDWLGGQTTSQGVAAIDHSHHSPAAELMRDNLELYYPADYRDFLQRIKNALPAAPGEGYSGDGATG